MTHWSTGFVGMTFKDLGNCWGLVRRVYADVLGIDVTDYGLDAAAHAAIAATIGAAKDGPVWFPVDLPREFGVAVFRQGRLETHIGVVVRPGLMLHVTRHHPARIERYGEGLWAPRLAGFWRHADVRGAA